MEESTEIAVGPENAGNQPVLIFSEQLFRVFKEADEHDHGRSHKAEKEHRFEQPNCKTSQLHMLIVACFWREERQLAR
jgi:hypothetical protein